MGRKNSNARRRHLLADTALSIEFNPQPLAVQCLQRAVSVLEDIDPVEMLYVWFVWGTLGILFLPSLVMILATI